MIVGVGVDIVDIPRFTDTLRRVPRLAERLFSPTERDASDQTLAGRFAAKEALAKALGAPGDLSWHDVEVGTGAHGAPTLAICRTIAARAQKLGATDLKVSISHDGGIAVAFVIAQSSTVEAGKEQ